MAFVSNDTMAGDTSLTQPFSDLILVAHIVCGGFMFTSGFVIFLISQ